MENPWKNTTSEIYNGEEIIVATADLKYIKKLLNSKKYPPVDKVDDDAKGKTKKAAKEKYKLRLNVYPQHFVGDIDNAKIIILSLNPGYSTEYYDAYKNITNKNGTNYEQIIKENLEMKQPFFHAFELANESDLGYWGNKMKCWVEDHDEKDIEKDNKVPEDKKKNSTIPNTQAFMELVNQKIASGKTVEIEQKRKSIFASFMTGFVRFLPTLIMLGMAYLIFEMQGVGKKGKVYDLEVSNNDVKFDDVAGLDEEKNEMIEIIDFLKNPDKYKEMGAKVPHGVLFSGKPGTGKTLIAKAIAGEAKVPFISMSGSEFVELFAGLGASRVRKLFERAKKIAPCIIFIDEIDAIGARRANAIGADTENNQTLNQLLVEMDGFESEQSVIVIAATNRPEMLDDALLRPGRFDRTIVINLPDVKEREDILRIHAKNKKFAEDIDLKNIAENTAGFSGAELANILNEAAIIATSRKQKEISNQDVEDALAKVTVGLEKKNRRISDKDKRLTAYHEAGHAVVSKYLPTQDVVKEVSIIPRGMAGGYTMYRNNEDKYYISETEMREKLISLMGGRAAEKIALNEISTGASNDLEVAMEIARNMVTIYGMNDKIGPMSLNLKNEAYEKLQLLGTDMQNTIGLEIRKTLEQAYQDAQTILRMHRDKLDAVAEVLMKKEKINEEEFNEIFNNY